MVDHVRVAADRLAAVAVVGQQLGLVAHADLPHLDARLILAGQVLDQLAEIDALLGQEIKDDALAAEQVLDIDQFHLQTPLLHETDARLQLAFLDLVQPFALGAIAFREQPNDSAARRLGDQLDGVAEWLDTAPVPVPGRVRCGRRLPGRAHSNRYRDRTRPESAWLRVARSRKTP